MEYILYGIGILIVVAIIIVAITSKNKKQTATTQEAVSELAVERKETPDTPEVKIDVLITTDERLNIETQPLPQEQEIEAVEQKDEIINIAVDSTTQEETTTINELEDVNPTIEYTDVALPAEEISISVAEDIPNEVVVEEKGKTKILFVDDSKVIVVKAKKVFSNYDFDVVTAIDGLDALEKLKTFKPDVIITDIEMPNLDGYGLIKEVRSFAEFNDTPIVMLTSHTHLVGKTHEYGAQGIVLKPFTEEDLIKQINEHTS